MLKLKLTAPVYKRFLARRLSVSRNDRTVCWPKPDYGPMEVMRSDLMNGIKVASAKPLGAQIGACTIMYQAGSRYEWDDQIGASHFLRALSSGSGCGYSAYMKARYLQQCGAAITCTSDRQSIAYTLRCPVSCFPDLKNVLLDAAQRCCYHQWEIDDRKPLVRDDLERRHPEQIVMDLVQRAAFAGPLANSVFCEDERISGMSQETLQCFAQTNFISVRCSVGSVGVPFEETLRMAERIELRRERPPDPCTLPTFPKSGYEYHDLGSGSDTWIALAVPGCSSCDISCLLKHSIVAAACGTGNIQLGQHDMDRTQQPPLGLMAGNDIYTDYKAFNLSYFDQGIFGVLAKTRSCTAKQAALCAAEFLVNVGDLDFKQIEVGKKRLKVSLALHDEDCVKVSEGLALQVANNMQIDSAKNSMCMVDLIPADEVCATAKVLSSKSRCMSVAVVGDIGAVPEGRELLCGF
ncbi:cytochrome b-c1 complex subunit 2, mitochondrial-like [Ostrinia furnacalis]|uniref:cytochrome b-c1 complex subunit 2, mitochondrial-like n=1 Tax=Ostrinia furnacalis TaxID=93504 RepID=UPI00103DBEEE|nr:cytochrome b-c1 complex subunit 2, mitochondrial-like [Ostrinia furnacalis]